MRLFRRHIVLLVILFCLSNPLYALAADDAFDDWFAEEEETTADAVVVADIVDDETAAQEGSVLPQKQAEPEGDDSVLEDEPVSVEQAEPRANTVQEVNKAEDYAKKRVEKANIKKKSAARAKAVDNIDLLTKLKTGMKFDLEEVEQWIVETPDLNACFDNGRTMLLYVIANSTSAEALRSLLENGADVQTNCVPRYEALFIAAINNPSPDVIELLLNNGANLVEKDNEGNSALLLAATFNKSSKVLDILIEYGLKPELKNKYGFDALMLAAYHNQRIPIIQTILDNEADPNAQDELGHTPLMAAAVAGNDEVMQYLISRGADANAVDKTGLSVLDYFNKRAYLTTLDFKAANNASPSAELKEKFRFIAENHHKYNKLLKEGIFAADADAAAEMAILNLADIDVKDEQGCTTFLNAAHNNSPLSILKKLIEAKADINATCENGKTALMYLSAQAGAGSNPSLQIEKAKFLIASGADVNKADVAGNTPLMYAAAHNADISYIEMLLKAGAEVNAESNLSETALFTAIRQKLPVNAIKLLLEYGADPNKADRRGETPLWYLLRTGGDETVIRALLRGGADVEITNAAGDIPLWYVLNKGGSAMVMENIIMVQKDLNIANEYGDTPLLFALKNDYPPSLIKLLLKYGADPNIRDSSGRSAYDILKESRFFDAAVKKRSREKVLNSWE